MEANVSLGRCECARIGNKCHDGGGYGDDECRAEAVRMVTVLRDTGSSVAAVRDVVPMCAACAEYHQARQKERV